MSKQDLSDAAIDFAAWPALAFFLGLFGIALFDFMAAP